MQHMVDKIQQDSINYIVDLGSGYCGEARFQTTALDSQVLAVNLSGEQNRRAEVLNAAAGADDRITVVDASYAARRDQPIAEVARVLNAGGEFLFTDSMAADGVSATELSGVLERLNLSSLASPSEYKQLAAAAGLECLEAAFVDLEHRVGPTVLDSDSCWAMIDA